ALGSDQRLRYTSLAAINLARHAHRVHAIVKLIVNRKMIEDVAVFRAGPHLASTHAHGTHRMALRGPIDYVQIVHMLFDNMIAGKPREIEPVPQLPFHIAPLGLSRFVP